MQLYTSTFGYEQIRNFVIFTRKSFEREDYRSIVKDLAADIVPCNKFDSKRLLSITFVWNSLF